jgi:hypothetical protein
MRFIMITTVVASVAIAMAVPALDSHRERRLCFYDTAPDPMCCRPILLGIGGLHCTPREFSLRLGIEGDRSFILCYL